MMADFELALQEVKPAFGVDNDNLMNAIRGKLIDYGPNYSTIDNAC
jgi:hypothetical protein